MSSLSDAEEIFTTAESEARLDLIRHLIENSELVPLVRGVSGIGKSLLASRLQAGAPGNWVVCHFAADAMMQPERLLAQIARCNGLPDAKEDNLRRLEDRFEVLRNRGNVPVLLIDDAQELPPTSLITLLRLYERQAGGTPLVSLVLFANEQIDMLLSTPQLQMMSPKSIQVIDLPPLSREEADAFMHHLLRAEGLDQRLALDASRLSRLYRETGGAPGRLASAILEGIGESGGVGKSAFKGVHPMLWGVMGLGVMLFLVAVLQGYVKQIISVERPSGALTAMKAAEEPALPAPRPVPPLTMQPAAPEPVPGETNLQAIPPLDVAEQTAEAERAQPRIADGEAAVSIAAIEETDDASVVDGAVPQRLASQPAPAPASPVETPAAEAAPAATARAVDASVVPAATPEAEQEVAASPGVAMPAPAPEQAEAPETPQPPAAEAATETESSLEGASLVKGPEWLARQRPGSLTIQLLAVENIESIQDVIEKYKLHGEAFAVKTERQGKAWYPLLWGRFTGLTEAQTALKRLPPELLQGGAWIRSLASLQQ